jgi:mitochondrial fission protein ELM1
MPQYRLPAGPNVLQARLPFNRVDPSVVTEAAADWAPRLGELRPPRIALLIGGRARPLRFDAETGRTIGRQVDALAHALDASVLALTSRRTPADAADALLSEVNAPLLVHRWRAGDSSNAYAAFLGLADRIVVTGDSGSMIAEACHVRKPVSVAPVPLSGSLRERLPRLALKLLPRHAVDVLHGGGWIVLPRDIATLWRPLARKHHLHVLGEPLANTSPPPDDLPAAVERIRALVGH